MVQERRRSPRHRLEQPVEAQVHTAVGGRVQEVSATGFLMRVRKPLAVGTACSLRVVFADGEVEARGAVRRCSLVGFETDEEGDRVRAYQAAVEFDAPVPELPLYGGLDRALQVHLEKLGEPPR